MPVLTPYENQVRLQGTQNITASAEQFGGASARATKAAGGVINDSADSKAKMQAARDLARARSDMLEQLNAIKTAPDFADKFGEDGTGGEGKIGYSDFVKKQYEDFANDFLSKVDPRAAGFAEAQLYSFGEGVMQDSMTYQASVAAASVTNTITEVMNSGLNAVAASPGMYDSILATTMETIDAVPHLNAEQRMKLQTDAKEQMRGAQLTGLLRENPYALKKQLQAGAFGDIDFQTRQTAIDAADAEVKRREATAKAAAEAAKDKKYEEMGLSLLKADGKYDAADIVNDPAMNLSQKRTLLNVYKDGFASQGNPKLHNTMFVDIQKRMYTDDPVTQADLVDMLDPLFTPDEKPLSATEYEDLLKYVSEPVADVANTFVTSAKSSVTKSGGLMNMPDPQGDMRYGQFQIKARQMARLAGQSDTPFGDLSQITPRDMFDQRSKHYEQYGGALIREFQLTDDQALDAMTGIARQAAEAELVRQPGETAADYMARRDAAAKAPKKDVVNK